MASIKKFGKDGSKRIQFFKRTPAGDVRATKVFSAEELKLGKHLEWQKQMLAKNAPTVTASLHSLFDRYVAEVSSTKRGKSPKCEARFFERLKKTETFKQDRAIGAVSEEVCQAWVDERLDEVESGTVYREFNTLADFFRQCASLKFRGKGCWKIIEKNPMKGASRPADSDDAGQVVTPAQLAKLQSECKTDLERKSIRMFEFAMETGMRRGEACLINEKHIGKHVVQLFDGETKSGKGRQVALSPRAKELLPAGGFDTQVDTFSRYFRNVRERCEYTFRIHDARHTAATILGNSGVMSVPEFLQHFGWSNIKMAQRYCKADAEHVAAKMASFNVVPLRLAA